jgi:hypothetical protein
MITIFCIACIFPVAFATILSAFASYRGNHYSLSTRFWVTRTNIAYHVEVKVEKVAKVLRSVDWFEFFAFGTLIGGIAAFGIVGGMKSPAFGLFMVILLTVDLVLGRKMSADT